MYGTYRDIFSDVFGILGQFGVTSESALAIAKAEASPTLANIQAVELAFNNAGTSAPPELLNALYQRYYDSIASNPYATVGATTQWLSDNWLWLLVGGGVLIAIISANRRRG